MVLTFPENALDDWCVCSVVLGTIPSNTRARPTVHQRDKFPPIALAGRPGEASHLSEIGWLRAMSLLYSSARRCSTTGSSGIVIATVRVGGEYRTNNNQRERSKIISCGGGCEVTLASVEDLRL